MDKIKALFSNLIGKEITYASSGGGAGSVVVFDVGEKEAVFFVKCAWRLEQKGIPITGSNEDTKAVSGNIAKNINKLKGLLISNITVNDVGDIFLTFSSNWSMSIFCDITPNLEDFDENWILCFPNEDICYTLTGNFKIEKSRYSNR
jgi:hypothetical protein